jgi:hypothetical protein
MQEFLRGERRDSNPRPPGPHNPNHLVGLRRSRPDWAVSVPLSPLHLLSQLTPRLTPSICSRRRGGAKADQPSRAWRDANGPYLGAPPSQAETATRLLGGLPAEPAEIEPTARACGVPLRLATSASRRKTDAAWLLARCQRDCGRSAHGLDAHGCAAKPTNPASLPRASCARSMASAARSADAKTVKAQLPQGIPWAPLSNSPFARNRARWSSLNSHPAEPASVVALR